MRNLLDFITAHYHWFLLLILEAIGATLLFRYNSYQHSVWVSSANTVAGMVYEGESKIHAFFALTRNNEDLSAENIYLQNQVTRLTNKLIDMGEDSADVVALKDVQPYQLIKAKVVHSTLNQKNNLITINRGEADGVKVDMGVISGKGVVGIVYMTGQHYSVIIPILSSLSSISCKIEGSNYFGHLKWEGKERNMAYVDDIPRHARFSKKARVVTSGYSAVFPEGIGIGKVNTVFNSPDGLSFRVKVHLYTDFANLRDVYVVDNSGAREQLDILRAAQDSLREKE